MSPGYFATLQIPLREGRDFTEFDTATAPPVAIVNRAVAERLFAGNALGQQFSNGRGGSPIQIVGIVEDGKYTSLGERHARGASSARLRSSSTTSSMLIARAPRRGAVRAEDLRASHPSDRPDAADSLVGDRRTAHGACRCFPIAPAVVALGLLGVIASGLLLSGLHAMLAYAVVKRHREIGIRVALGADREPRWCAPSSRACS